jgi:hypothetical protein
MSAPILDPEFLRMIGVRRGVPVRFPVPMAEDEPTDWTDAIDRLAYAAKEMHSHLADCLAEAHLESDPDRIARIAAAVKALELDAAVTLTAIVDREEKLRRRG